MTFSAVEQKQTFQFSHFRVARVPLESSDRAVVGLKCGEDVLRLTLRLPGAAQRRPLVCPHHELGRNGGLVLQAADGQRSVQLPRAVRVLVLCVDHHLVARTGEVPGVPPLDEALAAPCHDLGAGLAGRPDDLQ